MRPIILGAVIGSLVGAVASFAGLMAYDWAAGLESQPGGSLGPAMGAAGAAQRFLFIWLPSAAGLGAALGAIASALIARRQ